MDAGAALRASAISALRFAIMYLATGAIFTYGVAALWACIPSAADATMVRASINLTILRCMGILLPQLPAVVIAKVRLTMAATALGPDPATAAASPRSPPHGSAPSGR